MSAVDAFPVLFVCVGNVCRSPFAERLLAHRLDLLGAGDRFDVRSAGVMAMRGSAMHPQSAEDLAARGGTAAGFQARQFTELLGSEAGLLLTMTRDIRSRVLQDVPQALRRTFTVLELAALLGDLPGDLSEDAPSDLTAAALVRECGNRRSAAVLDEYDVPDPIGAPPDVFAEVATLLDDAVTTIAQALADTAG